MTSLVSLVHGFTWRRLVLVRRFDLSRAMPATVRRPPRSVPCRRGKGRDAAGKACAGIAGRPWPLGSGLPAADRQKSAADHCNGPADAKRRRHGPCRIGVLLGGRNAPPGTPCRPSASMPRGKVRQAEGARCRPPRPPRCDRSRRTRRASPQAEAGRHAGRSRAGIAQPGGPRLRPPRRSARAQSLRRRSVSAARLPPKAASGGNRAPQTAANRTWHRQASRGSAP